MKELQELLHGMDVPENRKNDIGWLNRNLFIRNSVHPNFEQAVVIIKQLWREKLNALK